MRAPEAGGPRAATLAPSSLPPSLRPSVIRSSPRDPLPTPHSSLPATHYSLLATRYFPYALTRGRPALPPPAAAAFLPLVHSHHERLPAAASRRGADLPTELGKSRGGRSATSRRAGCGDSSQMIFPVVRVPASGLPHHDPRT